MAPLAKLVNHYSADFYGGKKIYTFAYDLARPANLREVSQAFSSIAQKFPSYKMGKFQLNLRFTGIKAKNGFLKSRQWLTYEETSNANVLAREFEYTQDSKEMAVDVMDLEITEMIIYYFIDN